MRRLALLLLVLVGCGGGPATTLDDTAWMPEGLHPAGQRWVFLADGHYRWEDPGNPAAEAGAWETMGDALTLTPDWNHVPYAPWRWKVQGTYLTLWNPAPRTFFAVPLP